MLHDYMPNRFKYKHVRIDVQCIIFSNVNQSTSAMKSKGQQHIESLQYFQSPTTKEVRFSFFPLTNQH
jgi:hypothetical protein